MRGGAKIIMKYFSLVLLSLIVGNISDAVANVDKTYSFRSGTVKSALNEAKFGDYTLEELKVDSFVVIDDPYGNIDGFVNGTHMDGDKWKGYYRAAFNKIIVAFGEKQFNLSLRDAFDICIEHLPSSDDTFARSINHALGCKNFIWNLVKMSHDDAEDKSITVCHELLAGYSLIKNDVSSGVVDFFGSYFESEEFYCGGYCNHFGGDTVYILDQDMQVLESVEVDDFCDGESGGQYYWYYYDGTTEEAVDESTANKLKLTIELQE